MKRKRILSVILAAALVLGLFGCSGATKPPTWQEQYDLGLRYLSEGNYEEAIIAFTAAIEIDPKQALAYVGRGDAYGQLESTKENLTAMAEDYEMALTLDNQLTDLYWKLYEAYLQLGKDKKAERILRDGLEATGDEAFEEALDELQLSVDDITITLMDHSVRDANGSALIEVTYDLVQLPDTQDSYRAINQLLLEEYRNSSVHEDYSDYAEERNLIGGTFYNVTSAHVSYFNNGLLGITYSWEWYMGGVANNGSYGKMFDLETGREAGLDSLFPMESGVLLDFLKDTVRRYVVENFIDVFDDAYRTIEAYTLDSFDYRFYEDQLILCIPEYELAPGAYGPFEIETGLYLDEAENQSPRRLADALVNSWYYIGKAPGADALSDTYVNKLTFREDGTCSVGVGWFASEFFDVGEGTYQLTPDGELTATIHYNYSGTLEFRFRVRRVGNALQLEQLSENGMLYFHKKGDLLTYFLE